ncbi:MFS transporter [Streptomyces griseorubiginosus]|uniref:MFS transporter n=1 Tax=Streptomyces griseorubiginosus TaxID=67304 RepID=UPI0036EC181C
MPPRPHRPHRPMPTMTADALVIADFGPRGPRGPRRPGGPGSPGGPGGPRDRRGPRTPGPYRRLLATPGARAFTIGNLLARLPMGMFSVSAVVMIAGTRGSYALAGAVTAAGLGATAVVAPWIARLVDRYGQAKIAVPATLLAALGSLALLLCVRLGAPAWTLLVSYAATATTPNLGGMSRARWAYLLDGDEKALHVANSFEQAADEACFMLGPVLAAFLCGTFFPEAGTLAGVTLLVTGALLFAAQRSTEPPPWVPPRPDPHPAPLHSAEGERPFRRRVPEPTQGRGELRDPPPPASTRSRPASPRPPLQTRALRPLLAICLAMGAVFGSMEVVTIGFADAQGHRAAAGVVLGLQAAGSCAAGLVYGAVHRGGSVEDRYVWCITAMTALLTLPLLAALTGSLLVLACALLVAGMATAPTMVTGMTLVQRHTPPGRLNEGMTLAVTGLLGGIACGSAAGGWTVEHVSPVAGYGVPVTAAAAALMIALVTHRPAGSSNRFT